MDNKQIALVSVLMLLVGSLSFWGGASLDSDDTYYCGARNIVMKCDKLSKYYGLDNGKCWNEVIGNKLCRSGWAEVVADFIHEPPQEAPVIIPELPLGGQEICLPNRGGCTSV